MGGGFLIVPALVLLAGVTMTSAVGTSLAVITLNSFSGLGKYLGVLEQEGLTLDWRILLTVAAVGVVGSFAGQKLGQNLPQATLRRLFGVLLVVMGIFMAADVAPRLLKWAGLDATHPPGGNYAISDGPYTGNGDLGVVYWDWSQHEYSFVESILFF